MDACCKQIRAFTLIELMLVVAVLAIAMGLIAPTLKGFATGTRDKEISGQILALANYARTQAIAESRIFRLTFNSGASTYNLTAQENTGFAPLGTEWGREFSIPEGTQISLRKQSEGDPTSLLFYPTGRSDVATVEIRTPSGATTVLGCTSPTDIPRILANQGGAAK